MACLSGKSGKIAKGAVLLADITRWRFTTTADNVSYASSATGGYRRQIPGAKHGRGAIAFQLNPLDAITQQLAEGDAVTLLLYVDATRYYSVPAVIETMSLTVDVSTGDPVGGQAEFATDGAWVEPEW